MRIVTFVSMKGYKMGNAKITPNERQQQAIDTLNGQIMLLAGPGTGKTTTIITRIEKMLSAGIEPSSILCLTYSDAAANEMRQRLIKTMGVIASSVDIYTYHSFCNEIIKENPAEFNLAPGVHLITETEKLTLMQETIDETGLVYYVAPKADKYFYTRDFISLSEKLKGKRLTKEEYLEYIETNPTLMPQARELEEAIREKEEKGDLRTKTKRNDLQKVLTNIEKAKEVWNLYELYSEKMIRNNLIDFSDMINFVLDKFEDDKTFLNEISNKYKYFLVDEYQDTNDLQNSIIFNLVDANEKKNILVVGDDDQIIYAFQGARTDNLENFLTKYQNTQVICLIENNRSTQSILDFSYALISKDKDRLENNEKFKEKNISKKLTAKNEKIIAKDKKVKRLHFGEKMQEMNYIIDDIVNLINSENCPTYDNGDKKLSEIAIITRKRAELGIYAEMLKGKNIPFQIDEGKNIFSIRSTILTYFYIKALKNEILENDKLFGLLLTEPFKIDVEDYNKILHKQQCSGKNEQNDFLHLLRTMGEWKNPDKINDFLNTYDSLKDYASTNGVRNSIIEVINRTGILEYFYAQENNRMENLTGIKKIIEEATDYENGNPTRNLFDFTEYLDNCIKNEISICTDKSDVIQNAVQLTTFHGSKGREFEHVYLPNLIAKQWENFSRRNDYKLITEEVLDDITSQKRKDSELLKLLFVGITRAKHSLSISFADMDNGSAQQITKYLAALNDYDFERINIEYKPEDFDNEFMRIIARDVHDNQKAFKNEIKERVKNTILSPTRMNDYIKCPRNFFYTKILGITVEDSNWDSANFGTIIHSLLENAVKIAKATGEYPSIESIKADFEKYIENERFSSDVKKENFHKNGIKTIDNYYPYFSQFPIKNIEATEEDFSGVNVDEYEIKGKIDRIERNSDGTYSLYDYKTGTPVSENQIAIGGSKEGYFNQLCFYKYAYEKKTGKKVSSVGVIYVENHKKSVSKVLTNEDSQYIENKIKEVYEDLNELKFDPAPIDKNPPCNFCAYKNLCKLDII